MKPFFIAFKLWFGTISAMTILIFLWGILSMNGWMIVSAGLVLIAGVAITLPLLIPTTLLVRSSCMLPYSATSRTAWLGFAITIQNWSYIHLINWGTVGEPIWGRDFIGLFSFPTICSFIVIFFTRKSLRKLYSEKICDK